MAKYRDKKKVGPSEICPFKPGENARQRHSRRKATAVRFERETIKQACELGFEVSITNNAHHWQFQYGDLRVEWWPSSAKLVVDKQWRKGIHAHDHRQVIKELKNALRDIGAIVG